MWITVAFVYEISAARVEDVRNLWDGRAVNGHGVMTRVRANDADARGKLVAALECGSDEAARTLTDVIQPKNISSYAL